MKRKKFKGELKFLNNISDEIWNEEHSPKDFVKINLCVDIHEIRALEKQEKDERKKLRSEKKKGEK